MSTRGAFGVGDPVHCASVPLESGLSATVDGSVAPADVPIPQSARGEAGTTRQARRTGRGARARAVDAAPDIEAGRPTPSGRRGRPRRRGRRVKRVVRRIELWSVLKISLVFNTVMLGVALAVVALLWGLANTTGLIDDLEGFLRDSGFEDFRFQGDRMFQQVAFVGAVMALTLTVFTVLATALLNLISEITGGIRFIVIEEIVDDAPRTAPRTRGSSTRRPATASTPTDARPSPAAPLPDGSAGAVPRRQSKAPKVRPEGSGARRSNDPPPPVQS